MKVSLKQVIPAEFCLKCRGCCRFSHKDSVWQPHLLKEEEPVLGKIKVVSAGDENNFICEKLRLADNKCLVYESRPFECQLYPFLLRRKNNKVFLALDLNCAFARENNKNEQFEEYTRRLIELVQGREYLDVLKNNPLLAQEYEGVIDLAEIKM